MKIEPAKAISLCLAFSVVAAVALPRINSDIRHAQRCAMMDLIENKRYDPDESILSTKEFWGCLGIRYLKIIF